MNREIKFVNGLRAFKPHQKAPPYVIANFVVNIEELKAWVNEQTDDLRLDLMESKSLTYYVKVNDFTPDSSKRQDVSETTKSVAYEDNFDDDIPF
tara:strand:+ start:697 stop:981 length:285 start_codon:yes stop_codon:yes gene_type:complete